VKGRDTLTLLDGLNHALNYIEDNLDGEIDYAAVARTACCSQYHFQRLFVSLTDVPLSEYIGRRRLTQAALELRNTDQKVIDIAVKYGYRSADAFTRAFAAVHGMTPSRARGQGAVLKAYPRITFTLSIKGVIAMKYRIEEKPAFRVVGVKEQFSAVAEESFVELPKMWARCNADGTTEAVCKLIEGELNGALGICASFNGDKFDYWIAAPTSKACPPDMYEMEVPASTWAIFDVTGAMPKAIQDVNRRIYSEWLPTSGYDHAKTPDFELYPEGDLNSFDYKSEIWIPVVKK
jgi:AraC family transcriptional regulator